MESRAGAFGSILAPEHGALRAISMSGRVGIWDFRMLTWFGRWFTLVRITNHLIPRRINMR
ncbi:MAG: hypothetical protein ACO1N5_13115, partial [Noviherbaspirillum sp.]